MSTLGKIDGQAMYGQQFPKQSVRNSMIFQDNRSVRRKVVNGFVLIFR